MTKLRGVALAILLAAAVAHAQDDEPTRWACWNTPRDLNFQRAASRTTGDMTMPCRPNHMEAGTVVELNDDGTGWILRGYRPGGPAPHGVSDPDRGGYPIVVDQPFNSNRVAEVRWGITQDDDKRYLTIAAAARDSGHVNRKRWLIYNVVHPNVVQMQSATDFSSRPTFWKVGSPEHDTMMEWRKCVEGNKAKGFDLKPCPIPLSESVATEGS